MIFATGLILFVCGWLMINIFGSPIRYVNNLFDYIGVLMAMAGIGCCIVALAKLSIRYLV